MTDQKKRKAQYVADHPLFDAIRQAFNLNSDAALAEFMNTTPPTISRIRNGTANLTGDMILVVYDKTGWSIEKIRNIMWGEDNE